MNWLAHIYLATPDAYAQVGSLLPDIVTPQQEKTLPAAFAGAMRQHRMIDAFTDQHPVVRQSCLRLGTQFRRLSGVIIDVLYDHFLHLEWQRFYTNTPQQTIAHFETCVQSLQAELPPEAIGVLSRMQEQQWLASYATLEGTALTFRRINHRLSKPMINVPQLIEQLNPQQQLYQALQQDFIQFFAELLDNNRNVLLDDTATH